MTIKKYSQKYWLLRVSRIFFLNEKCILCYNMTDSYFVYLYVPGIPGVPDADAAAELRSDLLDAGVAGIHAVVPEHLSLTLTLQFQFGFFLVI